MADHLTDEEQLQILKNWWKSNGTFLLIIVVLAVGGYFGWQWWTQSQKTYAEEASAVYLELSELLAAEQSLENLSDDKRNTAKFLIQQLQNDYGKTLYAANASLLAAKLAVDLEDLDTAAAELQKAAAYEEVKELANLRLARVYFAQGRLDEALALVSQPSESYAGLYNGLKGDVLLAKDDVAGAKAAYGAALNTLPQDSSLQRRLTEIKLADLAGE